MVTSTNATEESTSCALRCCRDARSWRSFATNGGRAALAIEALPPAPGVQLREEPDVLGRERRPQAAKVLAGPRRPPISRDLGLAQRRPWRERPVEIRDHLCVELVVHANPIAIEGHAPGKGDVAEIDRRQARQGAGGAGAMSGASTAHAADRDGDHEKREIREERAVIIGAGRDVMAKQQQALKD